MTTAEHFAVMEQLGQFLLNEQLGLAVTGAPLGPGGLEQLGQLPTAENLGPGEAEAPVQPPGPSLLDAGALQLLLVLYLFVRLTVVPGADNIQFSGLNYREATLVSGLP